MKNQESTGKTKERNARERDLNPDPITGEPGSHPVGTGVGAAGGGVTGAAMGAIGGPVGAAIGGAVGAVAGGLAGKGVAEHLDPTAEEKYWEGRFRSEPYYREDREFEDYRPAYRFGMDRYSPDANFNDMEPVLGRDWQGARGSSRLEWNEAREASKASWDRVHAQASRQPQK